MSEMSDAEKQVCEAVVKQMRRMTRGTIEVKFSPDFTPQVLVAQREVILPSRKLAVAHIG